MITKDFRCLEPAEGERRAYPVGGLRVPVQRQALDDQSGAEADVQGADPE